MTPLSILISSYNQSETILQSVKVLQEEAVAVGCMVDIIICDDGSTPAHMHALAKGLQHLAGPTRVVWQKDVGFRLSASRNNGLTLSRHSIVLFIDGDCVPAPGFLHAHLRQHQQTERGIICVGKRLFARYTAAGIEEILLQETENEDYDIRHRLRSSSPWCGVLGRNFSISPVPKHVAFDERFVGWGMEEVDFVLSCYQNGLRTIIYEPEAIVTHHHCQVPNANPFLTPTLENVLYAICNALWIMKKHEQDGELYLKLAFYLFQYTVPFRFSASSVDYDAQKAKRFYENAGYFIPQDLIVLKRYHQFMTRRMAVIASTVAPERLHPYLAFDI